MSCIPSLRLQTSCGLLLGFLSTVANNLAYEEFKSSSGEPASTKGPNTALILHGLLGQGRNWRSFAKNLASKLSEKDGHSWRVLTLDLRCHGNSTALPDFTPPHTMHACAQDVCSFVQHRLQSHPDLVLGHSMGGKVAIEYVKARFLQEKPAEVTLKPQNVWILDSQPGRVAPDVMPDVTRVLQAVKLVKVPVTDRALVLAELRRQGFSQALVLWMVSNLVPAKPAPQPQPQAGAQLQAGAPQPLVWSFDVEGASELYEDYKRVDSWEVLCALSCWPYKPERMDPPKGTTMNVLRAEHSDRWTEDMVGTLAACAAVAEARPEQEEGGGSTRTHVLPNAGHWVHMDNPKGLMDLIVDSVR